MCPAKLSRVIMQVTRCSQDLALQQPDLPQDLFRRHHPQASGVSYHPPTKLLLPPGPASFLGLFSASRPTPVSGQGTVPGLCNTAPALGAVTRKELNKVSLGVLSVQDTDIWKLGGHGKGFRAVLNKGQQQAGLSGLWSGWPTPPVSPCLVGTHRLDLHGESSLLHAPP